ncbi:hypothetical protein V495_02784, partial [Pseudogymnoascus sp. VKM F-4514 (FW-929)]
MSLPAGGFITTRDGKRCTAVPKTTSSSTTSSESATKTDSSDDNDNDNDNDNNSDDVASTTVNPAANVVLGSSTTIQDALATTTVDAPETTDAVVDATSDTEVLPTSTPVTEIDSTTGIDPAAVAAQFGATTSTPTPTLTPTETAQPEAVQPDPESVTDQPIIVSDTTSDAPTVPIPTTPPPADSAESDLAFPSDSSTPSSTDNEQLIAVVPVPTKTPSTTGATSAAESATLQGPGPSGKVAVGQVVGGVIGGISFIALIGCLWLYFMRRRRRRDTFLTPLWVQSEKGPPTTYYEIDNASVGPTSLGSKWKAKASSRYHGVLGGFTALSTKMGHKPSPSVNLNRGNSQFLAPSTHSSHSRSSSSFSHPGKSIARKLWWRLAAVLTSSSFSHPGTLSRRERAREWWDRLTADAVFNWALSRPTKPTTAEPPSHFTRSRSASPSARAPSQDLTQYLASKDREMRDAGLQPDHRRSISLPPPTRTREDLGDGSLGIDFSDRGNPFSDPAPQPAATTTATRTLAANPFADPVPLAVVSLDNDEAFGYLKRVIVTPAVYPRLPQPSVGTTYVADVRRSRGQSFSTPRRASVRVSRERSRDRDTMLSSITTNTRRGKGRSDPFDLERPELLRAQPNRMSALSDVEELPSSAGSS